MPLAPAARIAWAVPAALVALAVLAILVALAAPAVLVAPVVLVRWLWAVPGLRAG